MREKQVSLTLGGRCPSKSMHSVSRSRVDAALRSHYFRVEWSCVKPTVLIIVELAECRRKVSPIGVGKSSMDWEIENSSRQLPPMWMKGPGNEGHKGSHGLTCYSERVGPYCSGPGKPLKVGYQQL